jgi:hypothetical protein
MTRQWVLYDRVAHKFFDRDLGWTPFVNRARKYEGNDLSTLVEHRVRLERANGASPDDRFQAVPVAEADGLPIERGDKPYVIRHDDAAGTRYIRYLGDSNVAWEWSGLKDATILVVNDNDVIEARDVLERDFGAPGHYTLERA